MFAASTCPSPKERIPGVSTIQPPAGAPAARSSSVAISRSAMEDEEVCRPRPVTAFTTPVARVDPGTRAFTMVDLPTPEWPTATVVRPSSTRRSALRSAPCRLVTTTRSRGANSASRSAGSARSVFVTSSTGARPASNAATR